MSDDVDAFFEKLPAEVRDTASEIRALVRSVAPDTVEKRHGGWKIVGYSYDGTVKTSVCAIAPHTKHVNLQFFQGTELSDPGGVLEGSGKRARHVKLRAPSDVRTPEVRSLVKEAAELARAEVGSGGAG